MRNTLLLRRRPVFTLHHLIICVRLHRRSSRKSWTTRLFLHEHPLPCGSLALIDVEEVFIGTVFPLEVLDSKLRRNPYIIHFLRITQLFVNSINNRLPYRRVLMLCDV